ncbi:MAG: transposase [Gaiellaceae bacterium]
MLGRKTDVSDAAWLCQLLEAGLLKTSFVLPKPIRTLRNLTRYRKVQIQERQREANRLHKILEGTGLKGRLDRRAWDRRLRDPRPPRLPRRADRPALGGDQRADSPFCGGG